MSFPVLSEVQPHLTHYGVSPVPALSGSSGVVQLSPVSELALKGIALEKANLMQASHLN